MEMVINRQGVIPHSLPLQDALHQCGSTVQQYQNTLNRKGMETPPLYRHHHQFLQIP